MTTLKVSGIASALAAAASICFEGTVPRVVILHISDHIFCLIVPSQAISAILLTIHID
jgi:hypothetical protein